MPAPGDQHSSVVNPFSEPQQRISEYTAQQIATLQSRLEKKLGPEYISSRPGPSGGKVHYLSSDKVISLANEVFGFNGWSSSIQNIQVDFVDENPQTLRISLGLSVIVRVTLRDGTYHEDLGYGHIENVKGKAAAFEKAKKEGTTDALKRALRHFGNVLGNCIYDKSYVQKVTKMKVVPSKFDEKSLHRHADFVVKEEPVEVAAPLMVENAPAPRPPSALASEDSFEDLLGELDEVDFNITEDGHPDEVILPNSNNTESNQNNGGDKSRDPSATRGNNPAQHPARPLMRTGSAGNNPPRQPQTPNQQPVGPNTNAFPGAQNRGPLGAARPPQQQFYQNRPAAQPPNRNPQTHMTPPQAVGGNNTAAPGGGEVIGFFSARAAETLPKDSNDIVIPKAGQAFNPRFESPSIRRTPGIDHTSSKPLARSGKHVPPPPPKNDEGDDSAILSKSNSNSSNSSAGAKPVQPQHSRPVAGPGRPGANVVNPQLDQTRRIGAPGMMSSSPLANRGQYRPPTILKRPAAGGDAAAGPNVSTGGGGGSIAAGGRVPLTDMSNTAMVVGGPGGGGAGEGGGGGGGGGVGGGDLKRQRIS